MPTPFPKHLMELHYTTDDDGIHLLCSCGEEANLDFHPSPEDVAYVAAMHLAANKED